MTSTSVDLSGQGRGVLMEEAIIVAKCMEFNRALTTLVLASNDIGVPDGWSTERNFMGAIENYKHADGRTQKERPQGTSSGIVALAKALEVNRALNSVDLRDNRIKNAGKQQLRDAVKGKSITLRLRL